MYNFSHTLISYGAERFRRADRATPLYVVNSTLLDVESDIGTSTFVATAGRTNKIFQAGVGMGTFLLVSYSEDSREEARDRFNAGIAAARFLKRREPELIHSGNFFLVASFSRSKVHSPRLVSDSATESWLVSSGSWFHSSRFGAGAEARLLSRYLKVGIQKLVEELDGFFAILIGDGRTGEVLLITDIIGSCHAYSRVLPGCIAISDSSAMLAAIGETELDLTGCQEFLATGILYEERTLFRDVRKTEPASVYVFSKGVERSKTRYWRTASLVPDTLDGTEALEGLWNSLIDSAKAIHTTFPRLVCDLTGGYDSRVLVAAFHGAGVPFSVTVSGSPESQDVRISRMIAAHFGWEHLHIEANEAQTFGKAKEAFSYTDGEYNILEYARILGIHKPLSERFDISVNGSFGEVARGYWWEDLFPYAGDVRPIDTEALARKRYAWQPFDPLLFPPEKRLNLVSHFKGIIERTNSEMKGFPNTFQMDNTYLYMRMQRWQGRIASSTNQQWPCISPFMFRPVLEALLQTRSGLRRRSLLTRKVLTKHLPSIAAYPLEHGNPAMPLTWSNLHRFLPLIGHYSKKIKERLVRKFRSGAAVAHPDSMAGEAKQRLSLWREEEVKSLLLPSRMGLCNYMDPTTLSAFLDNSLRAEFRHGEQWARLLTLEYGISLLAEFRRKQNG